MLRVDTSHKGSRILLILAALVIVVAGLREIRPIALPMLVALFLSILSAPLVSWLMRRRVPKLGAVALTVLANVAVVAMLGLAAGGSMRAFATSLPTYQERLEERAAATLDWLEERGIDTSQLDWLQDREDAAEPTLPAPVTLPPPVAPPVGEAAEEMPAGIALSDLASFVGSTLRGLASIVGFLLLVLVLMVFLLLEGPNLPQRLRIALGWKDRDLQRLAIIRLQVQRYLGYKTLVSLATGLLVGVWVWILDVEFPVMLGLIGFLLNYIPTIGSILAAVPAVVLALADLGPAHALAVVFGYLVVNMLLGNFIEPHLMGRRLGLSTLVVFLSLLFWGWLWGPVGMLLSVPLTMILRIALENTEDLRWLALMLAAKPSSAPRLPRSRSASEASAEPAGSSDRDDQSSNSVVFAEPKG
ncbi:MAG: AI-2E family transporter [Acidobacteriota bacterium]